MAYVVAATIQPLAIWPYICHRDQTSRPRPYLLNPSRRLCRRPSVRLSPRPSLIRPALTRSVLRCIDLHVCDAAECYAIRTMTRDRTGRPGEDVAANTVRRG